MRSRWWVCSDSGMLFEPIGLDVVARGERVPTLLFVPRDAPPNLSLVVFGHGANLSKNDPIMQMIVKGLARAIPAAVAIADFPAHGERVPEGTTQEQRANGVQAAMSDAAIYDQITDEWRSVVAAARVHASGRVGYIGFSMGSVYGLARAGQVAEFNAFAFVVGGLVVEDGPPNVGRNGVVRAGISALGAREVLMCNMTGDETFPIASALDAFALVPGPKRMHVFEGGHADVPPEAVESAVTFFQRTLAPRA
ncbi:MAG: hypothetical protein JWL83_744 [Actinomycetia bacterium]|nr:hypothetical protein [Actinomycetes bacterium]